MTDFPEPLRDAGRMLSPTIDKPYHIFFEHRPSYLYVRVQSGSTDYAMAKRYWAEILRVLHQRNYTKVLVDKDIGEPLAPADTVILLSELAHSGCRGVKFAVFDRRYDCERCSFEEMVAINRGLKIRVCHTIEEACAHLETRIVEMTMKKEMANGPSAGI